MQHIKRWRGNMPVPKSRLSMAVKLLGLLVFFMIGDSGGVVLAVTQDISGLKDHDVKQPIDISADSLEVKTKGNTAVFQGHVEAIQKDLKLNADRITVYYRSGTAKPVSSSAATTITRIDASGNVQLTSATETVNSNWGVYDLDTRIVTLGGAVKMKRGTTTIRGDRLQLDLETGLTRIEGAEAINGEGEGRVRGRFVPPTHKE